MNSITNEPSSIRAGDSFTWRCEFADYPASAGWSLGYRLVPRAAGVAINIESASDGDAFVVAKSSTDTSAYAAGDYTLVAILTRDSERITVSAKACTVLPDLLESTGLDDRSNAQKIVEAIDAWLSDKSGWAGEKTIGNRTIKSYPLPELMQLRSFYAQQLAGENAAAGLVAGLGVGRGRVMVRM